MNNWWIGFIGVFLGGILTILTRLLGDRYLATIEHRRWKREKQAEIAEKSLGVYNELLTYLSLLSLGEKYSWILDRITQLDLGELLTRSRELSSVIPLYFNEDISILWLNLIMMLQGTFDEQFVLEFDKMLKGERVSKETEEFFTKLYKLCELFKKELNRK